MRAMILAAGRGQRLSPLTDTNPKPLMRVGDKTLIEHQLSALNEAGIRDVVINTGWLGQQLIDQIGLGGRYGLRIEYSVEPQTGLETGGGIFQALALLGDEPFILLNADVYHRVSLGELRTRADSLPSHILAHLVMVENPEYHPEGDFHLKANKLSLKTPEDTSSRELDQKPKTYTYSGIGIYRPELFAGLKAGRFPLAPLLKRAINQSKLTAHLSVAKWFDAGTVQRIEEIERFIKSV